MSLAPRLYFPQPSGVAMTYAPVDHAEVLPLQAVFVYP